MSHHRKQSCPTLSCPLAVLHEPACSQAWLGVQPQPSCPAPRIGTSTLRNMVQPRRASSSAMSCMGVWRLHGLSGFTGRGALGSAAGRSRNRTGFACTACHCCCTAALLRVLQVNDATCLWCGHNDRSGQAQSLADAQLRVSCRPKAGMQLMPSQRSSPAVAASQPFMCIVQFRAAVLCRRGTPCMPRACLCRGACQ